MSVLGVLGMYDFNAWMVDYGTNLDPHAIMKLANPDGTPMTYKPPLLGHAKMLNFDVTSLPETGAWLMFVGMMLTLLAFYLGWKNRNSATQ
jgi:LPXTG-motif cell wall-anchored protein